MLLATRGPELAHSASQIAPLLGAETTVVTLQGGLPFWLCYGWAGRMENEPPRSTCHSSKGGSSITFSSSESRRYRGDIGEI